MGKIIRRILTIIPAVALQSLWLLLLMKWLTPYAPIIVSLLSVAAFFLVVFIIIKRDETAYKLLWLLVILSLPLVGALLYLLFGNKRTARPLKRRLQQVQKSCNPQPLPIKEAPFDGEKRMGQTVRWLEEKTQYPMCAVEQHFLMCLLYITALGVLSFVVGRLIPKHWFHADRFPWVCHPAEQKLWKRLHVRKWQAKIPDMSRIFVKIMPEKKLTKENYENLPRMIEETCVAEWTHILLSIAGLGLLKIWSGVGGVCITIIYIVLGNLPFIVVQRYNRPRLQKLFAMQQRKK